MAFKFSGKQDVYLELAKRFEDYIISGVYSSGEKLPSVRALASEFGINPNTVAKAYSVLESKGLIRSLPKKGVFVIGDADKDAHDDITLNVRAFLTEMKEKGLTYEELILQAKEVFDKNDQDQ